MTDNFGRKIPIPRKLELQETAASIRLWKVHVTNYYKSDKHFKRFVGEDETWNPRNENWGFTAEAADSDLKRTAPQLKDDCNMFLETFASYLPDDYLVEKLVKNTTKYADIWTIIEDFYGVALTSDTFLELAKMKKKPQETYRQFYLRMEGFVSKHLTKGNVKVEDMTSPARGDQLTISIRNLVVIMWMKTIHEKFIDCVRIEFASELRGRKQLIELLPRLADNVDNILARHDISSSVSRIEYTDTGDEACGEPLINRVGYDQRGRGGRQYRGGGPQQQRRGGGQGQRQYTNPNQGGKTLSCAHCDYLAKTLKLKINTNHEPTECIRKDVAIRLMRFDELGDDYSTAEDDFGALICTVTSSPDLCPLQTEDDPRGEPRAVLSGAENVQNFSHCANPHASSSVQPPVSEPSFEAILGIQRTLLRTEANAAQARSPALKVTLHNHPAVAVIDEGAEVSCIALKYAKLTNTEIVETSQSARAADSSKLRVVGRTKKPVILITEPHGVPIYLKYAVVVDQLSADVLIGEPGKGANKIVTYASEKKIRINFQNQDFEFDYHKTRGPVSRVARVEQTVTRHPGETYLWKVPAQYREFKHLFLQPRHEDVHWFEPGVCQVLQSGHVALVNSSDSPVTLQRGKVFCEIQMVDEIDVTSILQNVQVDEDSAVNKVFTNYPDQEQYVSKAEPMEMTDHSGKIQIDPGKILDQQKRDEILKMCQEYPDVIRPEPGLYNGFYGHIDNKIDWKSEPPYTQKVYQQRLSEPLKELLGQKMDELHRWGVLQFPEQVGVRPRFLSPSMLVPKQEKNQHRLVSNFCNLNKYIEKPISSAPTMQEAKDFIASKDFHIHCDFSNFFYQSGMERQDIQYLGTLHPTKGVMVFVCEPQGIVGAPEHSYERLGRIFHDLIEAKECVRMADGLHIGSNTTEGALKTLKEVLDRSRKCNLTLKPSKLEIFPQSTTLFGWTLKDSQWMPTVHTTSALAAAPLPTTIKQLRGFLGSYKQFSSCVQRYGEILCKLEALTGSNKPGAEKVPWTEELKQVFYQARESTKNVEAFAIPRPTDRLFTYSDFSRDKKAIGGKLEFERTMEDGRVRRFLGGYFSVIIAAYRALWWPCEGEAFAVKSVLEHFERYLRENFHTTVHFTDNLPVVDAWKRARKGAFSSNARISTFLMSVVNFPVEIRHKAGAEMLTTDYISRHPQVCPDKQCALCKFTYGELMIGDNCMDIREITVEDVTKGDVSMPLTSKNAWLDIQKDDLVHVKLRNLIELGQAPPAKPTKGDNNKLKLLHNLYKSGDLRVDREGLVQVKHLHKGREAWVISVPWRLYPGLCTAMHLKFNHPSKGQLLSLMSRYFYCPGHGAVHQQIQENCSVCQSMKLLPKTLKEHTASPVGELGTQFATDIMLRNQQKLLVTVENVSGFTMVTELPDQTADSIRDALLTQVLPYTPEQGAVIRSDGASSFQSLLHESKQPGTVWARHNVSLAIGEKFNPNKNARAENKIREISKEFLRHCPDSHKLSTLQLTETTKTMNARIRSNGLASREILLSRALISNKIIDLQTRDLSKEKFDQRELRNSQHVTLQQKKGIPQPDKLDIQEGDLVFLRDDLSKHHHRDQYIVHKVLPDTGQALVRKAQSQLQSRKYKVKISDLIHLFSRRPWPQVSAQKNTELSQDQSNDSEEENESGKEEKLRKEKVKMKKILKEEKLAKKKPIGKGEDRSVSLSVRPKRKAAMLPPGTYVTKVYSDLFDNVSIKAPWRMEDQPEADLGHYCPAYVAEINALMQEHDLDQAAHDAHVQGEAEHQAVVQHAVAQVEPDQESAVSASDTSGSNNVEENGVIMTDSDEDLMDRSAQVSFLSTDSSEYHELPSINHDQSGDYIWDDETESPTFQSPPDSVPHLPSVGAQLPPHWPPRRLSSEYTSQLEVTLLPGAAPCDERQYFHEDAVFQLAHEDSLGLSPEMDHASLETSASTVGASRDINFEAAASAQLSTDITSDTHLFSSDQVTTNPHTSSPLHHQRHSSRLESKDRVDYKVLDSEGRTGKQ